MGASKVVSGAPGFTLGVFGFIIIGRVLGIYRLLLPVTLGSSFRG